MVNQAIQTAMQSNKEELILAQEINSAESIQLAKDTRKKLSIIAARTSTKTGMLFVNSTL